MRRRPLLTHADLIEKSSADFQRHLISQSFVAIHRDSRDLLMRGYDPSLKSKGMSKRLGQLEAALRGEPAPEAVERLPLMELMKRAGRRMG